MIEVKACDDGCPSVVKVRGRHLRVAATVNMWRIDEEWWRRPVSRIYFLLEFENGAVLTVFQDLESGRWYRQNWRP